MDASEIDHPDPARVADQHPDLVFVHCNRCERDVIVDREFQGIEPTADEVSACTDCFRDVVESIIERANNAE